MDDNRFDALTRALAGSRSRRTLAASLVGVALAAWGTSDAAARQPGWTCKEFNEHCNNDDACCAGKCSPKHLCHCHHWQQPCGPRKCCRKDQFATCCPNPPL